MSDSYRTTDQEAKKKFVHEVSLELNNLFGRAEVVRNHRPVKACALEFIARAARKELQDV